MTQADSVTLSKRSENKSFMLSSYACGYEIIGVDTIWEETIQGASSSILLLMEFDLKHGMHAFGFSEKFLFHYNKFVSHMLC